MRDMDDTDTYFVPGFLRGVFDKFFYRIVRFVIGRDDPALVGRDNTNMGKVINCVLDFVI